MGAIPPLSEGDWNESYAKYQASPQGSTVNKGMALEDYKTIFYWEYFHRLAGRVLGFLFVIPWAYFWIKGLITRGQALELFIGFCLGGLQGLMGWLMVKSGLVDIPAVSHYRLAAHLLLALLIFWWFFKRASFWPAKVIIQDRRLSILSHLILLQIIFGAFVAGLKAGYSYQTFPLMNGGFFPPGAFYLDPWWINPFQNPATVQWIHRWLGVLIFVLGFFFWAKRQTAVKWALFVQVVLGIFTLILGVPVWLGVAHQVFGFVVYGLARRAAHTPV